MEPLSRRRRGAIPFAGGLRRPRARSREPCSRAASGLRPGTLGSPARSWLAWCGGLLGSVPQGRTFGARRRRDAFARRPLGSRWRGPVAPGSRNRPARGRSRGRKPEMGSRRLGARKKRPQPEARPDAGVKTPRWRAEKRARFSSLACAARAAWLREARPQKDWLRLSARHPPLDSRRGLQSSGAPTPRERGRASLRAHIAQARHAVRRENADGWAALPGLFRRVEIKAL